MAQGSALPDIRSLSDLLSGLTLSGQCWCYSDVAPASGFSVPPSDAVYIHFALHGEARIACTGGEVARLSAGEAICVLSGEAHALRTGADAHVSAHPLLRADTPADVPPGVTVGPPGRPAVRVLSGRLKAEWPGGARSGSVPALLRLAPGEELLSPGAIARAGIGPGSAALLTRLASALVIAALRADPRCRRIIAPEPGDPVALALALIEANPSAPWSVEKLARSVGMGRSNFAAHFTADVGRAPMEVVAEQRMDLAARLVRQGRLKVAEISELSGYGSEAAFSRRFTRHFGISPSAMREAARAEVTERGEVPAFASLLSGRMLVEAAALGRQPVQAPSDEAPVGLRQTLLRSRRR